MEFDLLSVLGKNSSSPEVRGAIRKHRLVNASAVHAGCVYVGSNKKGVDLVIENRRVIAIQIFVQPDKSHAAFADPLPFGIKPGMTQKQVHKILGKPKEFDEIDSQFDLPAIRAELVVRYDDAMIVNFLNISQDQ